MTINIVQFQTFGDALSGSFSNPTSAGNCVIVFINVFNNTDGDTPSTSGCTLGGSGGNFTKAAEAVSGYSGTNYALATIWVNPGCAGGQTAIGLTGNNLQYNADYGIMIMEVSGLAAASVVDKTSTGNNEASTSWSSGTTATTTIPSELWVGASTPTGGSISNPGSPWTVDTYTGGIGNGYQIVSSTGTATFSGTQGANAWAAAVVTLKSAPNPTLHPVLVQQAVKRAAFR